MDVSSTGLRVLVTRYFEPGKSLVVALHDEGLNLLTSQCASVCWVQELGPKSWEIGCEFSTQLGEDDLNTLLGNLPKTAVLSRH